MKFPRLKCSRARAHSIVPSFVAIFALVYMAQPCQARQHWISRSNPGENPAQMAGFFGVGFESAVTWIYCAFALCLVTAGMAVIFRRNKERNRTHHHRRRGHAHAPVPARIIKNKPPINSASAYAPLAAGIKNATNGHAQPKLMPNPGPGAKPFHRHRGKRIFDYPKFYTTVMKELSRHQYGPPTGVNGKSNINGHANGNSHAGSNGHAHVPSRDHAVPNGMNAHQTIKSEIDNLIAAQKGLIQEQKSILEQQNRLIEEKHRLIDEQAAFLNNQSRRAANE